MEFLKAAIAPLVASVTNPIFKHVAYPFKVDGNVRDLQLTAVHLGAVKEDIKIKIINAKRENGAPTEQVKGWLDEAEAIEKQAADIYRSYLQLRRCIWNICPNLWLNYKISKTAAKKHVEMKSLCERERFIEVIFHMPPPLANEIPSPSSRSPNLELALHLIKDDVHNIIGIWGTGGVGKTHLLTQINNELYRDPAFDVIVFITCSRECSLEKVQDEMISQLGLVKSTSTEVNRRTICSFLRDQSFVLLMDDLWSRLNLDKIGIPNSTSTAGSNKTKIVLTTRLAAVCGEMEVNKMIKVNFLNWDEAWSLFKEKVTEEIIKSHPLIQKYAVDVANELGGLPLALITVGRAMRNKTDPNEWELAVERLKQARLSDLEFSGTDETVFKVLKFSYDKLRNDNLRECFLHCSLWPEDYKINKNKLVELWMGLGLIDECDIHMAYNVGYSYITELQAACLMETTSKESCVKLHDIIRDMSLWIVNYQEVKKNKWIVQSDMSIKHEEIVIQRETEKISLMCHRSIFSFSSTSCDTKLTTLLLTCSGLSDIKALKHQSFSKLTVLNLQRNRFLVFPIEICSLTSLQFIDLSDNEIKSLPNELGALINLKYLLLKENMIYTIPVGVIFKLQSLQVLDLTPPYHMMKKEKRGKLSFIPPLLEGLVRHSPIRALGIEINDLMQFQQLNELSNVHVRWLTLTTWEKVSTFSFSDWFLETSHLRSNLFSLGITNIEVDWMRFESISENPNEFQFGRLEHLYIFFTGLKEMVWKGLDAKHVFPRLKCLTIYSCEYLTSISWVVCLPYLQELKVIMCPSINKLIDGNEARQRTFPFLKLLELRGLGALESICNPKIELPALETLKIEACGKLKKLPFQTGNNIPPKLNCLRVEEEWWNNLEGSLKSSFSRYVRFLR